MSRAPLMLLCLFALLCGAGLSRAAAPRSLSPAAYQRAPAALSPEEQALERLLHDGQTALDQQQFPQVEAAIQQGRQQADALGNPLWQGRVFRLQGRLHARRRQWEQANASLESALPLLEKSAPLSERYLLLDDLGDLCMGSGRYERALEIYRQALALARQSRDEQKMAVYQTDVGQAYLEMGRYPEAIHAVRQVLQRARERKQQELILDSLTHLGMIYWSMSQVDTSLELLFQAREELKKRDSPKQAAKIYVNLAHIYSSLGQYEQAVAYYAMAQPFYMKIGDMYGYGSCIINTGLIHAVIGDFREASRLIKGALDATSILLISREGQAYSSLTLGLVRWYEGNQASGDRKTELYREALRLFQQSLNLYGNEPGLDIYQAYSHGGLGLAYSELGDYDRALEHTRIAIDAINRRPNNRDLAILNHILSRIYEMRGELTQARHAGEAMIRQFEAIWERMADASQTAALQELARRPYPRHAGALLKMGNAGDALQTVERGRGRSLAKQAAQSGLNLERGLNGTDRDQLRRHRAALDAAGNRMRAAMNGMPPGKDRADLQRFQETNRQARQEYEKALRQLTLFHDSLLARPQYAEYRRRQGTRPPALAEFRRLAARRPDTLFLEWAVLDERTMLVFALSEKGGLRAERIALDLSALAKQVADWRIELQSVSPAEAKGARALYDLLFSLLEKKGWIPAGITRLAIVADGPLLDIPFAALLDSGGRRLVERYALSSAVSLASLTWPASRRSRGAKMLCVADPTGKGGERLMSRFRNAPGPLPAARREVRAVGRLFRNPKILIGPEARAAVVKRIMGDYDILHFATHGETDNANGLNSHLILAGAKNQVALLSAREIVAFKLAARMAVLSACQSARGQKRSGEGLLGLAWAFQAAGCPSVVASQWNVNDIATQKLMVAFYRGLLQGRNKDEALRRAMLAMQREARYAAPFYWAAFQVIGDTGRLLAR